MWSVSRHTGGGRSRIATDSFYDALIIDLWYPICMSRPHTIFLSQLVGAKHTPGMKHLRELADVLSGVLPPKGADCEASYVQIRDLRDPAGHLLKGPEPTTRRATSIRADDLLVPSRGEEISAFRPSSNMFGAFVGLDVYLVRPANERVDPAFLFVALNDIGTIRQLKASATGGALPRIPKQALEHVLLPVPSMDDQRAIARIGTLVARCEALQHRRGVAEARLNAAIISRLLRTSE